MTTVPSAPGSGAMRTREVLLEIAGVERFRAAMAQLAPGVRQEWEGAGLQPWVPLRVTGSIVDSVARELGEPVDEFAERVVREVSRRTLGTIYRAVMRFTWDDALIARAVMLCSRMRSIGRLEARMTGPGTAEAILEGQPGMSARPPQLATNEVAAIAATMLHTRSASSPLSASDDVSTQRALWTSHVRLMRRYRPDLRSARAPARRNPLDGVRYSRDEGTLRAMGALTMTKASFLEGLTKLMKPAADGRQAMDIQGLGALVRSDPEGARDAIEHHLQAAWSIDIHLQLAFMIAQCVDLLAGDRVASQRVVDQATAMSSRVLDRLTLLRPDRLPPEDSPARLKAREWWQQQPLDRTAATCDGCSQAIARGTGFFVDGKPREFAEMIIETGEELICRLCFEKWLARA